MIGRIPLRQVLAGLSVLAMLTFSVVMGVPRSSLAQDVAATPGGSPIASPTVDFTQPVAERPISILSGPCGSVGETIATLEPVNTPAGEAQGQGGAIEAALSYTEVPLSLSALLTGETNISAFFSAADAQVVVACGEIGGVVSEGGSLVLKLSSQNDSGFSGIAYLAGGDSGTTGISTFLAGTLTVSETRELAAVASPAADLEPLPPTPEPTPTAEPMQVADIALLEWLIDMPTELRAGQINFAVTNEGAEAHGLVIEGQGLRFEIPTPLQPGNSTVLAATLPPGDYLVYCPVGEGEHQSKGMEGTLTIVP